MSIASTPASRIVAAARVINPASYPRAASAGKAVLVEKKAFFSPDAQMTAAVQSAVPGVGGDQLAALGLVAVVAALAAATPTQRAQLRVQFQTKINEVLNQIAVDKARSADKRPTPIEQYLRG